LIEWKPVKGYEGLYEVSSEGEIRSLQRKITYVHPWTGKECTRTQNERILRPGKSKGGYLQVSLCGEEDSKRYVHRLVADAFVDGAGPMLEVNHINGDKYDNSADNLEWVTHLQNMRHALANGMNRWGKKYEAYA
jgi:hypothetical protein